MSWTLRRKILAGFIGVIALAGVVLSVALVNIIRLGSASEAILQENYRSILAAEQMLDALSDQENAALQLSLGVEKEPLAQFTQAEQQFLVWLSRAKDNITIEGETEILQRIEDEYQGFLLELARFRQTFVGDPAEGMTYYHDELQPRAANVRAACESLHKLNRTTMEEGSRRAQQVAHVAVWSMLGVGLAVLLASSLLSVWLANRLVRPVLHLTELTEQVAAGKYDVRIEVESRDEVGRLAEKFNVMVNKLRSYHELNLRRIVGEQKKAETILNAIDDGVLVVGADGRVSSLNPTAARALGTHRRAAENAPLADVVSDERLRALVEQTLATGAAPPAGDADNFIAVAGPGESQLYYEYTLTPISAAGDERFGVVVLLRNVTKLKELDRLKTEFVMTASHELRTPLTSIAMSIGLLCERAEKLDPPDRELLEVAHEELARLRTLVEELLNLSKIESGRLEMEWAEVAVETVLQTAVAPFRAQAQEQSLELTCQVDPDIPPLRADPNKLTWVITNLIGNALRYARRQVEVSGEKAGRWINLYVKDDGKGIPHEYQHQIFDKFVQVEGQKTPGGAGLGLAIAKEIVRAHGGNIWVESEPDKGSLFIVALPAARPPLPTADAPARPAQEGSNPIRTEKK